MIMLKTAWRNLWRNKKRTFILVAAIAVGLSGILFFTGFMNGYLTQMQENAVSTLTGHVKVIRGEYRDDPVPSLNFPQDESFVRMIRANPIVVGAAFRAVGTVMASNAERSDRVSFVGVQPDREGNVSIVPASIISSRCSATSSARFS